MRALLAGFVILSSFFVAADRSQAEDWPNRQIKMVVPYSAGGSGDIVARELARRLTDALGQSVFVENKAGASGNIGTEFVAKAAPDGYTLIMSSDIQFAIAPNFYDNLPFKTSDFAPVSLVANLDLVLAANPKLAANNVRELVALAKKEPGTVNFGSTGPGSTHQLAMLLLQQRGNFKMTEVPYRGSGQALPDLLAGRVQMMLLGVPQSIAFLRDHKLKALAVGASERIASMPDVPTIAEQGFPGFEANNYWCLFVPANTPKAIIDKLQKATAAATKIPALREKFLAAGLTPIGSTPEQLAARLHADSDKWAAVIRDLRVKEKTEKK